MKRNAFAFAILALLCAGFLIFIATMMSQLPERVAMHFGLAGGADGWMSRESAATFFVFLSVGLTVFFMFLAAVMNWMPNWTFNLPHREYWLAPERRAETIGFLSRQLIWIGCLMELFFYGIFWLTILANRATPPQLPMDLFLLMLAGFLLLIALWTGALLLRFSKNQMGAP